MKKGQIESQNIEYKESWRDEYLKWVCGFANASGGKIYIGIKDNGEVCGVKNARKLLENLPNMIRDTMGLVPQVNLQKNGDLDVIEIIIEPSSFPVSYRGEYHYRSGSTKQQLKGNALTQFLLKKTGLSWDSSEVNNVGMEILSEDAFAIFRENSISRHRMTEEDLAITNQELLEKLNLFTENGQLTKAGYLLFARDPNKKVFNSYIKVGYFEGPDVLYQDEVRGSLFKQAENCVDLIFTKYLKATITYNGVHRVETFPFPIVAIREAVYNAIVHRAYSYMNPTQIRVYSDKIIISNDAAVLDDWTHEKLMDKHKSIKYNPLIADAFFKGGFIETWGRGIEKICNACKENGNPLPRYEISPNDVTVIFDAVPGTGKDGLIHKTEGGSQLEPGESTFDTTGKLPVKLSVNEDVPQDVSQSVLQGVSQDVPLDKKILELIKNNNKITRDKIASILNVSSKTIQRHINKMSEIRYVGSGYSGHWEIVASGAKE